jgi:hypothetical protein
MFQTGARNVGKWVQWPSPVPLMSTQDATLNPSGNVLLCTNLTGAAVFN